MLGALFATLATAAALADVSGEVTELLRMRLVQEDTATPPTRAAAGGTSTPLPLARPAGEAAWLLGEFNGPSAAEMERAAYTATAANWAVYLPFLYNGGQIWVNGQFAGEVAEGTPAQRVRWERPHLIPLPPGLQHAGANQIAVRVPPAQAGGVQHLPRVYVGPLGELQPRLDQRLFWVRTMPQTSVAVCLLVAGFVLFIYWRRPGEVLYGLFGLAAALWGVRTLTFVIERMPVESWQLWRVVYLGATGGFIIVLAVFAMRFAGIRKPVIEKSLLVYWSIGPLWLLLAGAGGEAAVNHAWSAGLIPIGLAILGLSVWTMHRQRTVAATVMPATLAIAVLAGVHDYLIAWDAGWLARLFPQWASQRIFLLHYGANLMLLGMGGLLTARFVQALSSQEVANKSLAELNETLELRVAERERHLAANFERLAELLRQQSASNERQLIMREIHDGLGSRLFTSLLRVERGDMGNAQIADTLRDCIADMRLALEALSPDDDFQAALGNFLFRWQTQMQEARVQPAWSIDLPEGGPPVGRHVALQLLRVAQEALTNVLKHAGARHVHIKLTQRDGRLELEVADDGIGTEAQHRHGNLGGNGNGKRGIGNMHARARQLGGELQVLSGGDGTRVLLRLPLASAALPRRPPVVP